MLGHALDDPGNWLGWLVIIAIVASAGLTGFAITLYSDRPKQISWVKKAMIPQLVVLGASLGIFFTMGRISSQMFPEAGSIAVITLALIFQYIAIVFIKKDEALVRSMDRIR